jgi:hypothetical protein
LILRSALLVKTVARHTWRPVGPHVLDRKKR